MTTRNYYFEIIDCRYSGKSVWYSENEDSEDTSFQIELELPKKGYNLYIINEFSNWDIVNLYWFENYKDANQSMLKLYAQINACMPFKVTGTTSSYIDTGYFPDVPTQIQEMKKVAFDPFDDDECYFVIIVDQSGIIDDLLIQPIA